MTNDARKKIVEKILLSVNEFFDKIDLENAEIKQQLHNNNLILINNSFIFRKPLIKTKKNNQFIMIGIKETKPDISSVVIGKPSDFDVDIKMVQKSQQSAILQIPLEEAIDNELKHLGNLIFFLIGELIEDTYSVDLANKIFKNLKFDPNLSTSKIDNVDNKKILVINQLVDPGISWNILKPDLLSIPNLNMDDLEKAFDQSFEKIQNEARLVMKLPNPTTSRYKNSFITKLQNSVSGQRQLYMEALNQCLQNNDPNGINLREIMRISYNFADDALKIMQLFVSLCDLKAIILWMTLSSHFSLAESIRNLPWTKSDKKASPKSYVDKIHGARNHAFHNLFLFDRTIEADLEGMQVPAKKLTLLPPHSQRKNTIPLDYEDREIVEILSELTRATETVVTLDFWLKNSKVIESFEKLLSETEDALWMLNSALNEK